MSIAGGVRANLLLCDAAQVVGGKLYILGGGWSYLWVPSEDIQISFAAAVDFVIPWDLANRPLNVVARLVTEDGEEVVPEGMDEPIRAEGVLVAGRPPTARAGHDLHAPNVIPFPPMRLAPGGYVLEIVVDTTTISRSGFQVVLLAQQP